MLRQRIAERGEKHPTLKASGNVAAVLGSFSASFRPVRFWARSAEAIARGPTGDRADADGDVDYLIDEQVTINPRPPPDTVFATTVDTLRPILAQLDRFAAIDVSPEGMRLRVLREKRGIGWVDRGLGSGGAGVGVRVERGSG